MAKEEVKEAPTVKCSMASCKQEAKDADVATKEGWYLDPKDMWWCYQHVPPYQG